MRAWERALRRAGIPLVYSGGYNPRPKLQLANALPLGHSAEAEILDIWLEEPMEDRGAEEQGDEGTEEQRSEKAVADFAKVLTPVLPEGLEVREVCQVNPDAPAMQTQIVATEYRAIVDWQEPAGAVETRIERALSAGELPHQRRGRRYNLRPLIEDLWLEQISDGRAVLGMRLSARPGATGRPEAVLDVLGMGDAFARYQRRRLIWEAAS